MLGMVLALVQRVPEAEEENGTGQVRLLTTSWVRSNFERGRPAFCQALTI